VKTVERAIMFLKENGVIKIFHTKRSNGLNGNCYYVLQPFEDQFKMDDEKVVNVDEGNVGAREGQVSYETPMLKEHQTTEKLFISSDKALKNSLKTKEEIIKTRAYYLTLIELLKVKNMHRQPP
jgi:hypothetical protein